MTIGIRLIQGLLIQVVGQACQAATVTLVVSTAMEAAASGGRPQSPVPTRGFGNCTTAKIMSTVTTSFETTAFLLVASGIKNFKL